MQASYDSFLDAELDRVTADQAPRDGLYQAHVRLGPLIARMVYEVRFGEPAQIEGLYLDEAWCGRTMQAECVEISTHVMSSEAQLLAHANPHSDELIYDYDYDGDEP
ncbi:MAG: hypothetical protein N2690_02305 [Rhodocyclaceae bacterium]|nr:hypothetical protein [Rhodocyclaceae bacterium]